MHPYVLDFGFRDLPLLGTTRIALPTYGVLFAAGLVLAWWWFARRIGQFEDLPQERVWNAAFVSLLAGILGAKLGLLAVEWRYYLERPRAVLETVRSAGVLLVGVGAGFLACSLYCRRYGIPFRRVADAAAPPVAAAQAVGRLGCFAAGCCHGVPARGSAFAVTFTDPDSMVPADLLGVPLFPIQLVQMANDLVLAGLLAWLGRRPGRAEGSVFWWYVLLYGVTRSILEMWRGDEIRGVWLGGRVSTSQVLGLAGAGVAAVALARGRLRSRAPATA